MPGGWGAPGPARSRRGRRQRRRPRARPRSPPGRRRRRTGRRGDPVRARRRARRQRRRRGGRRRAALDRQGPGPRARGPRRTRRLDRAGRERGRGRDAPRRSSATARPARRWRPGCSTSSARPGVHRPALALTVPVPGRPVTLLDVGANADVRAGDPRPVRLHGRRLRERRARRRAPARGAALQRQEAGRGSQLVIETHARLAGAVRGQRRAGFRRQRRGHRRGRRRRRRGRHRRLHRQRRAEADRGRLAGDRWGRSATSRWRRCAAAPAGCCCGAALRGFREEIDPETPGRRLPARAAPARRASPTGASRRRASRARSCARAAASTTIWWAARTRALEAAGALRALRPRPRSAATVPSPRP